MLVFEGFNQKGLCSVELYDVVCYCPTTDVTLLFSDCFFVVSAGGVACPALSGQGGKGCSDDNGHGEKRKREADEDGGGGNGAPAKKPKEIVRVAATRHDSKVLYWTVSELILGARFHFPRRYVCNGQII